MHCLSPKMVCETKIVAEDHESIPGSKKDTIIVSSSQMWPSLAGSPPSPPPPLTPPKEDPRRDNVYIREFHPSEQEVVRRIFYEGIMERIPNTAFRGLKQQPLTQLLYGLLAGEYPLPFGEGGSGFIRRCGSSQNGRRGGRRRDPRARCGRGAPQHRAGRPRSRSAAAGPGGLGGGAWRRRGRATLAGVRAGSREGEVAAGVRADQSLWLLQGSGVRGGERRAPAAPAQPGEGVHGVPALPGDSRARR